MANVGGNVLKDIKKWCKKRPGLKERIDAYVLKHQKKIKRRQANKTKKAS